MKLIIKMLKYALGFQRDKLIKSQQYDSLHREEYTAISIYVVGSKLQAHATRPKGGMGRLELILGFRGCRREIFAVWTRHC